MKRFHLASVQAMNVEAVRVVLKLGNPKHPTTAICESIATILLVRI